MDRRSEVLERLANTTPRQLCDEAKLERCRAIKDLRTCGRNVQHCLLNCGHACLCGECTQRCQVCPICRTPISKESTSRRLRLHDDCLDAGLLAQVRDDDLFHRDSQFLSIDARRLFQIFDVALDHNLVSVICHYVTDVCLDETAVSSDPALSVLLDGAVVKEWCKKTFQVAKKLLKDAYKLGTAELARETRLEFLEKTASKLKDVVTVLETLDTPAMEPYPEPLLELKRLLEGIRRALQHLQIVIWAARNKFLEGFSQRYADFGKWRAAFRQRKQAVQERAWPDYAPGTGQLGGKPPSSLFIEEAIAQLQREMEEDSDGAADALDLEPLRHGGVANPAFGKRREVTLFATPTSAYPPDSIRAALDNLFLDGSSDLFLAKKAIFLYYLFDRFWNKDDDQWKSLIDDYVQTFSIPRHFVRESFVFFLLDDDSSEALQEVCQQLSEMVNQSIHPRVPRVLLERHQPDAALSLLRRSGQDGRLSTRAGAVSLAEAVTAVRVWLECGLLTEGYLYQRAHCSRVKAEAENRQAAGAGAGVGAGASESEEDYFQHVEALVGEVCWLCIRRGWVDRMLMLPWTAEEEQTVHSCLLARAAQEPAGAAGSLLVVFYLQRCRYSEAQQVHRHLCEMEEMYSQKSNDEGKLHIVEKAQEHRGALVNTSLQLLTEAEREKLRQKSEASTAAGDDAFWMTGDMETSSAPTSTSFTFSQPAPTDTLSSPLFSQPTASTVSFSGFSQPFIGRPIASGPRLGPSQGLPHHGSQTAHRGVPSQLVPDQQLRHVSAGKGKGPTSSTLFLGELPRGNGSPTVNGWEAPRFGISTQVEPSPMMARRLRYDDEIGERGHPTTTLEKEPSLTLDDLPLDSQLEPIEQRLEFQSPLKNRSLGDTREGLGGGGSGSQENGIIGRMESSGIESGGKKGHQAKGNMYVTNARAMGVHSPMPSTVLQEFLTTQSVRKELSPSSARDGFTLGGLPGASWRGKETRGSARPVTGSWQSMAADWSAPELGMSGSSAGKRRAQDRGLGEDGRAGSNGQGRVEGSGYGQPASGLDGPSTSGASNGWTSFGASPAGHFQYGDTDMGFSGGYHDSLEQGASQGKPFSFGLHSGRDAADGVSPTYPPSEQSLREESQSRAERENSLLVDPEQLRWRTDEEEDARGTAAENSTPSLNARSGRRLRALGPSRFYTGIG